LIIFISKKETNMVLKEKIEKLRLKGKTYNEISKELNVSKSTISYHCKSLGLDGDGKIHLNENEKNNMDKYYLTHSLNETAEFFNVSRCTVNRYTTNKINPLTDEERKTKNYSRDKSFRQKIKEKAVE